MSIPNLDSRGWLAVANVLLLSGAFAALLFIKIPDENRDLVIAIASGVIGATFKDVYSFYFGSSKGSADANDRADKALDIAKKASE